MELKSPMRLCKYKLCSSKDVAYYWLNPSGWAANKHSCSSTVPSLQSSSPSSLVLQSDTGSFVEWLFWSGWKIVQVLGVFGWADFQPWSLTWLDILSRHKGTELIQGTEFKTHEKRTCVCKQDLMVTTWHSCIFHAVPHSASVSWWCCCSRSSWLCRRKLSLREPSCRQTWAWTLFFLWRNVKFELFWREWEDHLGFLQTWSQTHQDFSSLSKNQ